MLVGGDGAAALALAARIDHDAGVAMRGGQQHLLPVLGWIGVDGEQHGRRQGHRCGARAGQLRRQHDAIANGDAQCVVDGEAALLFRHDQRRGQGSGQGLRTQYRPQAQQFQGDGLGNGRRPRLCRDGLLQLGAHRGWLSRECGTGLHRRNVVEGGEGGVEGARILRCVLLAGGDEQQHRHPALHCCGITVACKRCACPLDRLPRFGRLARRHQRVAALYLGQAGRLQHALAKGLQGSVDLGRGSIGWQ